MPPNIFQPPNVQPPPRKMNPEFARRVRSFIKGADWSAIIAAARNDLGCEGLHELVMAGTPPSAEDTWFAQSIDWCVSRKDIELNNVVTADYSPGNWWYLDPDPAIDPPGTKLVIWGVVRVQLQMGDPQAVAETKAEAFARHMIRAAQLKGGKVSASAVVVGQNDLWDIEGRIALG